MSNKNRKKNWVEMSDDEESSFSGKSFTNSVTLYRVPR